MFSASLERSLLLLPLFPLFGSIITYVLSSRKKSKHGLAGWLALIAAVGSYILTLKLVIGLNKTDAVIEAMYWEWFAVGSFDVALALRFDRLAAVMSMVVTGVGSLIHLYAIGYMADDENRPRFFAYLNLFLFAMLLLVLGANLLVMFIGWEGVGLCSYLLIGFWYKDMPNAKAGQKAFIVNRIGDAGFLLGMFALVWYVGTLDFVGIEGTIGSAPALWLEIIAGLLFIGAVGKSAQIPLFIWLPDAMAGPTPVSALIHAATMVTAGVYMVARLGFLFSPELAPVVLTVILVIGTLTALLAATIALVQNDIKKVLAYSTVSQLGYMFMAMGVAAYSNGIYHVVTHAFFKACLFMAAGSVIIGCHHEQDMRKFGGLRKSMPITFFAYLLATLAIAGFPGFSGFFSKDAILWTVFSYEGLASELTFAGGTSLNKLCWGVGLFTALLTAFYMTRSLVMTFFGEYRGQHPAHESRWVITAPLIILAMLSLGFGFLAGNDLIPYLAAWTRADMNVSREVLAERPLYHSLEILSIAVALVGIILAFVVYRFLPALPGRLARMFGIIYRTLTNKWWVDEIYDALIVKPLYACSRFLFSVIDRILIDGTVNGVGMFVQVNGEVLRWTQTGRLGTYALLTFSGMFFLVSFYLIF